MDTEPREEEIKPDQSEAKDELIELYPKGDVVLVVSGSVSGLERRFLVHSELLTIVSPYFAALFGPGTSPQVQLKEDDTEAMEIILSLLHFKIKDEYKSIEPTLLALVARESNKYGCTTALWPWIFSWLHGTPEPSTISTRAIKQLAPGFRTSWSGQEVSPLLPQHIEDTIEEQIFLTLDLLHIEIQKIEGVLQSDTAAYKQDSLLCCDCGRLLPCGAGQCRPCRNKNPHATFCTTQTRVAEYFNILMRNELWPSVAPFGNQTTTRISNQLSGLCVFYHQCKAGLVCPLKLNVYRLTKQTNHIIRNIKGVKIK
ncbi:hypothetical protein LZ32DRAFT_674805 [Colletotrichum eremochloae]|nr:hypothetical protein LZ32DRAFT_674805 [Colletotrichum eremochloae]